MTDPEIPSIPEEEQEIITTSPLFNLADAKVARKFNENHQKLIDSLPDFDSIPPAP